jgi:hypothetical protein
LNRDVINGIETGTWKVRGKIFRGTSQNFGKKKISREK